MISIIILGSNWPMQPAKCCVDPTTKNNVSSFTNKNFKKSEYKKFMCHCKTIVSGYNNYRNPSVQYVIYITFLSVTCRTCIIYYF